MSVEGKLYTILTGGLERDSRGIFGYRTVKPYPLGPWVGILPENRESAERLIYQVMETGQLPEKPQRARNYLRTVLLGVNAAAIAFGSAVIASEGNWAVVGTPWVNPWVLAPEIGTALLVGIHWIRAYRRRKNGERELVEDVLTLQRMQGEEAGEWRDEQRQRERARRFRQSRVTLSRILTPAGVDVDSLLLIDKLAELFASEPDDPRSAFMVSYLKGRVFKVDSIGRQTTTQRQPLSPLTASVAGMPIQDRKAYILGVLTAGQLEADAKFASGL